MSVGDKITTHITGNNSEYSNIIAKIVAIKGDIIWVKPKKGSRFWVKPSEIIS